MTSFEPSMPWAEPGITPPGKDSDPRHHGDGSSSGDDDGNDLSPDKRLLVLFPPPLNLQRYSQKPLPPIPPRERPLAPPPPQQQQQQQQQCAAVEFPSGPDTTTLTGGVFAMESGGEAGPLIAEWERESRSFGGSTVTLGTLGSSRLPGAAAAPPVFELSADATWRGDDGKARGLMSAPLPRTRAADSTLTEDSKYEQEHAARRRQSLPDVYSAAESIATVTPLDDVLSPQPEKSMQKILKLTGNVNGTARSNTPAESPTLHMSSQKIKQLTGLDLFGESRRSSFGHLRAPGQGQGQGGEAPSSTAYDDHAPSSYSDVSPMVSHGEQMLPDETYYSEPADSDYSHTLDAGDDDGGENEAYTPLTIPKFPSAPYSRQQNLAAARHTAHASLGAATGFSAADARALKPTPGTTLSAGDNMRPSWYNTRGADDPYSSNADSDPFGDDDYYDDADSDLDPEDLEPTVEELYHETAHEIAKSSPGIVSTRSNSNSSSSRPSPMPLRFMRTLSWKDRSSINTADSDCASTNSTTARFSLNRFRSSSNSSSKKASLSERRLASQNRVPSPLHGNSSIKDNDNDNNESTSDSSWKAPLRTPYPVVPAARGGGGGGGLSDDGCDDGPRSSTSMLSRIFTGDSGDSTPWFETPTSAWSPDSPVGPPGSAHSEGGIFQRTLDQARLKARLRSKAERAER